MKIKGWAIFFDAIIYDDEDWYSNSWHEETNRYSTTIYTNKEEAEKVMEEKKDVIKHLVGHGLSQSHVTKIYVAPQEIEVV